MGPRDITVSTPGGTSNALVFTVLPPPPTLISISPASGVQQSSVSVTLTGTHFVPALTIQAGPLVITAISVVDSTSATALVTIPLSTQTGSHNVTVANASGTSAPLTFTVLPGTPSLTEIRPSMGIRGRNTNVLLTGSNFATGSTSISPIPGVVMSTPVASGSTVGANFNIAASAPLGPHSVTVTTPAGTTNAVTFSIVDPFPDLTVGSGTGDDDFYAGLNGTYFITVLNNGTGATTTPMIVTDLLPPELTFISGGGNGFSCSASGQLVTCTYPIVPYTPSSITTFTVTVAVSSTASGSLTHTVSVPLAADLNPSNNSVSSSIPIQTLPELAFTFTPLAVTGGQQATVALSIPTTFSQNITGTLNLSFSSTASNPADDPAIQFATGGRQVTFVITAGNRQARFGSAALSGPIGYQTGTVAGSVTFSGTALYATIEKPFTSSPGTTALTIPSAPPVVQSVRTTSQGGFALLITSSSTPRSITELSLQFGTIPSVQLSCGSVPGCTASGTILTFDVRASFDSWFSGNSQFGGLNTLRLPITIQGSVLASVTVTLKNSLGSSNAMSVVLP